MNLAEKIKKEQTDRYAIWKKEFGELYTNTTKSQIKQYGKASALCHGYIRDNSWNTIMPCDKKYLLMWIKENGFHSWESCNAHGAQTICWNI